MLWGSVTRLPVLASSGFPSRSALVQIPGDEAAVADGASEGVARISPGAALNGPIGVGGRAFGGDLRGVGVVDRDEPGAGATVDDGEHSVHHPLDSLRVGTVHDPRFVAGPHLLGASPLRGFPLAVASSDHHATRSHRRWPSGLPIAGARQLATGESLERERIAGVGVSPSLHAGVSPARVAVQAR